MMGINREKENIEACFTDYETIQEAHLQTMRNEQLPNIELMSRQREQIYKRLKDALDNFIDNAGTLGGIDNLPVLKQLEGRIGTMIALDEKISNEILKHKERLKKDLAYMKKGRVAMQGYGHGRQNAPFVVNMNK